MDLTRETQRLFASKGGKTIYFNLVNMLVNLPPFANRWVIIYTAPPPPQDLAQITPTIQSFWKL